ncbi:TST [Acanthosepion pharaonis]|uniref:Sulfurtransferase n=1 Tax=Acanthosepion pharaonis TaxID=158019 RepID=A0A812ASE2_ACAPH|nr:TST [Sepia pharaonis]
MIKAKAATVVSAKWLARKISEKSSIRILDGSYHLPNANRNAKAEYQHEHIPGALFFDIDECSDVEIPLPHMLPSTNHFENYVGSTLGIDNNTHVVIYDTNEDFGLFSAPRVWWTFRVFGHDNVSILDGGIPKWRSLGLPVTQQLITTPRRVFSATYRPHLVKNFEQVAQNINTQECLVVDARSKERFEGTGPEPRPGIRSGHFSGARNIPFQSIMDLSTKTIMDTNQLIKLFQENNVDLNQPLFASCGTGLTACCISLAAFLCGKEDVAVYDGSWTEWAQKAKPIQILSGP